MEDDWRVTVHDAKSGAFVAEVQPQSSTWSTSLTGAGQSSETIVVNDAEQPWAQGEIAALFRPHDRLLCRSWGGVPIYAHKIEDYDYSKDAGTVTVAAVDLRAETDWRLVNGVSSVPTFALSVSNRSATGAIRAALNRMMYEGAYPDWVYPIDLPADGAGDITDKWEFWRKYRISDIIKQIEDRAGVETYFRPYATGDDGIRFQTRVAPAVTIGASTFNLDADESPLSGVHYKVDGKRQLTGLLGVGNGSGQDQETAWAGGVVNIPIRDSKQSFPDLTGAALQQATSAYYHANTSPLVQWSIGEFTVSGDWTPVHASPGRVWTVESYGDPVIPDGAHVLRVISVSGGSGRELKVEVQSAAA